MSNYQAIIAKVDEVQEINGADRIQVGKVLGETVIIGKEITEGYVGVFFCAGCQLSEDYCKNNNLYRDSTKNIDQTKTGFFDDNRRVRAQPFMKIKSEGYFAPLESLEYLKELPNLKIGDTFEDIGKENVCKKYINPRTKLKQGNANQKAKKKKSVPDFVEHVDTAQFKYNLHKLEKGDLISIQSKIHGTSARYGYHKVNKELNKFQKLVNKILPVFKTESWEYVCGTRRVILDNPDKEGFHGKEQYRFDVLESLKPYLSRGMTIYGEISGYANDKPIMSVHSTKDIKDKKYTKKYGNEMTYKYNCVEGSHRFHIYRITLTTEDGTSIDFTQPQLVQWCKDRGFIVAYDVVEPFIYDGDKESLLNLVTELTERPDVLTEDYHDPSHVSEGVIVRVDNGNTQPLFLKNKSYVFKIMEGITSEKVVEVEDEA